MHKSYRLTTEQLIREDYWVMRLGAREITEIYSTEEDGVPNHGFSETTQTWYGWSHRAIHGFAIGSRVLEGDTHYVAPTPEGLIECYVNFFADISQKCADERRAECAILPDRSGIAVMHTPIEMEMLGSIQDVIKWADGDVEKIETIKEVIFTDTMTIYKCGRGEWTAKTLEDAKEMAIDFAKAVA